MENNFSLTTTRLSIAPLSIADDSFILDLINTQEWIKFIGNRNVNSLDEANAYIQKIIANECVSYWVVSLKENQQKIGIITFIKRDYLEHHDIGFAFLPSSGKKGYAYEATTAVLDKLISQCHFPHILATTIPENINSIKLLKRMGFTFEKEMQLGKDMLHIYGTSADDY